jgi:hypothetical protein
MDQGNGQTAPLEALRDRLAPVAAQMGARAMLPEGESGLERLAPKVNLSWSIGKRLGRELAQLISRCGIFLYGDEVVTVDEVSGSVQRMSGRRFGSWVEKYVETVKTSFGEERPTTMSEQLAKQVLESDQFRETLRPLRAVHPVWMPVRRDSGKVELLSHGYDEATGIFTCRGISFNQEMGIEEARKVFFHELKGFGFADIGPGGQGFYRNRSVAVQVAFMLGNFCRGFFPEGTLRPMSLLIANQPGSGKGVLGQMQLAPVYGMPKIARKPKDDSEFDKRLDTTARALSPYLFLDDIGFGLFSNALNAFITEPVHSGRSMNTQDEFTAPNVTQLLATGNGIKLTRDLDRRSLILELHEAGEIEQKVYDHVIDPLYLARPDVRARLLAAMWSFVREWEKAGCPLHERPKPSFEGWTSVIGMMTRMAGFSDPLEAADLGAGGDEETSAWKEFLARVAGEGILRGEEARMFTVRELLDLAKGYEEEEGSTFALDDLVGHARDANKAFGNGMKKWKGRDIVDTLGRTIRFGKRREATRRGYTCEVLSDPHAT